ncbi:MAG: hypothetical protein A2Y62_20575 [Candidatus Fischerbacteria bacterium RBG_13_37_8]|uniref:Fimbrial assembly protein n=1 Tax=Candidatus Fischerbacteria bacterium RBG_13_37_8 TaxID=1817863 RepID=A0A1F5VEE0_9BACT|nr:MAG: hypothetical protein A2Y62_20575 [Candidatus Fischerbacteria bacterium RBG_13_37_8]
MIKINLLETTKEREPKGPTFGAAPPVSSIIIIGIVIVAIGLIVSAIWWYQKNNELNDTQTEVEAARQEVAELKPYIEEVVKYEKKKNLWAAKRDAIDMLRRNRNMPVHLLDEITKNLPQFLWLESVDIKGLASIDFKGQCSNKLDPSTFVNNLESSDFFKDVKLTQVMLKPSTSSGGETYEFIINAKIDNPFQQQPKAST